MVESTIREKLSKAAMDDWAEVVAIEPELENWIWVEPLHLQTVTAWSESTSVNEWLKSTGKWAKGAAKPSDPKAALDDVCQLARVPRSAVIYKYIAAKAGLAKCTDPAFLAMRSILQGWFPPK